MVDCAESQFKENVVELKLDLTSDHILNQTNTILCNIPFYSEISPSKQGLNLNQDNFQKEIEKIRKRRSSVGKGRLPRKPIECEDEIRLHSSISGGSSCSRTDPSKEDEVEKADRPLMPFKENPNSLLVQNDSSRTISYNNKTKELQIEIAKWMELKRSRFRQLCKAEREFLEAENRDTVIEEDDILPNLPKEIKSFLLAKPNYEQYFEEVRIASDQISLTNEEVKKAILMCQSFIHISKLTSEALVRSLEKETFSDVIQKNPKDLLKEMMQL